MGHNDKKKTYSYMYKYCLINNFKQEKYSQIFISRVPGI